MEPMLRRICATNLLSFGTEGMDLELPTLTVLIGPNGSGKSNLLEVIGLLQAAPTELATPVRDGGGVRNWIWKGQPDSSASVEAIVKVPNNYEALRHTIEFEESDQVFMLVDERIERENPSPGHTDPFFFYKYQRGFPVLGIANSARRELNRDSVSPDESILSQRKDPDQFPELASLSHFYERIRLYREWEFGRNALIRRPNKADVRSAPLTDDFSNLGMFLNRMRQYPKTKASLFELLGQIYEGVSDFELNFEGGTVQVFFTEGEFAIPATRLSDSSLRYLCLLAILLDPKPPRLVGIEEPEVGMHPDLIPQLADLLIDASSRCQLIVTTHSDILVDSMSDRPEAVVVCEKHEGRSSMRRLGRQELGQWLEKYRLGQLWTSGELGGVRW